MAVDFSIDDTDVYTETEKEFSQQEEIFKLVEWKRRNTATAIDTMQKGLLPRFLDITWKKTDTYFKNGVYVVSRNYFETCLNMTGLVNNIFVNEDMGRYFSTSMTEGYKNNILQPFLLFINKVHIPWSSITVVRSDNNISLLISGMDKEIETVNVDILYIPFQITYTEDKDEIAEKKVVFRFDKDGKFGFNPSIFVYFDNDNIETKLFSESSYTNFDMGITYLRKLTKTNIVTFDSSGLLVKNPTVSIANTNLITISPSNTKFYVCCIYSSLSNRNESISTRVLNEKYEKSLINGTVAYDETNLRSNFEFDHSKNLAYTTNINDSLKYVFGYDESKFDKVFEGIKPVNIVQYDVNDIIKKFNTSSDGSVTMLKDVYEGNNLEVFPVIFHNGKVPEYYSSIEYKQNSFKFKPTSLNKNDTFEIVYFKGISNKLVKLDMAHKNNTNYLNIDDYYILKEDLVVYSACRGEQNLFPLNYTIDSNDNIILNNSRYLEGQLYIGSKKQFIYERYNITTTTNILDLSDKFRTAYRDKKFMVFVNGRLLNAGFYRVLVPSLNNSKIAKRAIYTMKTFKPTDRIDVFYVGAPSIATTNTSGDMIIECVKVDTETDGQVRFKIPYPFDGYPRSSNSFFCIKNSTYVDKARYQIDGDYIVFIDGASFTTTTDLLFLFPCYESIWYDEAGNINTNIQMLNTDHIRFQEVELPITADSQSTFTIPFPYPAYKDTNFFVSVGSVFFTEDRYTRVGDTIVINTECLDVILQGRTIKFTFIHNKGFSYISKKEISVPVAANQTIVDIPTPFNKVVDLSSRMIVTNGSVYLDRDQYVLDNKNKQILIEAYATARNITFTFFYVGNNDNGAVAYIPTSGYVCIPRTERRNFNKEMYMMFVNGRKVAKSELLDITNNLVKVSKDIQRRYDLVLIGCSPSILEMKALYSNKSLWGTTITSLPIE